MKRFLPLFFIQLLNILSLTGQENNYLIRWETRGQSFNEFVNTAESFFKVKFFYRNEWVSDIILPANDKEISISVMLDNVLTARKIYSFVDSCGNIILTKDFRIKTPESKNTAEAFIPPTVYSDLNEQDKLSGNRLVEIGNPEERNRIGNVVISGYVKNKDSKEPVVGAAVYVKELSTGSFSNEYGFYTIHLPRGYHNIRYTCMGMKETVINARIYGSGKLDVEMKETLIPLKEAVIVADRNNVHQRFEVGLENINMRTFKLMPTSMGETDVLKGMLLLPGVKTMGEGSSGFNVRGGSADQNLFLLNGAPVYNTSHFFGFFSAVNSDIIKNVLLYKGGIPAQYGGRVSSVIDIIPKDGSKEEFKGNAGISPVTTHITTEIPIIKDKMSLVLAGRATYSNWILGLIHDPAIQNSQASFYDFNGRMTYEIDESNKLELSYYLSHDSFRFNSDTLYSYDNQIFSSRWRHTFNSNFTLMLSANSSFYGYDIGSSEIAAEAYVMRHKVNSSNIKADFNWYKINNHRINFGADLTYYALLPGEFLPSTDSSLVAGQVIEKEQAAESSIYGEDRIKINDFLSVNLGVRLSLFTPFGPASIPIYNPELPFSPSTITDTLNIKAGKAYKVYGGPEFRISANIKLTANSSLKVNYNGTRQYMHLLTNTTSISPTDSWKLSDYYIKPQSGHQIALGYYIEFPSRQLEFYAETYFKKINNMVDFKGGTNLIMNDHIERDLINLDGRAYGLELMLKKSVGKLNWNLSYTYSRILVRSITQFPSDAINGGKWYPASYDKPHDLSLILSYFFSRRASFSATYTYSTGRPITYPVALYEHNKIVLTEYSDRNKYRIPYYSRLDVSARFSGNLKSHKLANPAWTFSVYNLLGRDNVYSIYFKSTGYQIKGYKLSVFAQPIPTITYSFDF